MLRFVCGVSLALGLMAGVAHADPDPFAKVPVAFESEPSGARITVWRGDPHAADGCTTPCTLALPPWEVEVAASLAGHLIAVQRVELAQVSGTLKLTLKPVPADPDRAALIVGQGTGGVPSQPPRPLEVRFESTPPGAVIHHYAPTRPRCTSPCSLTLPPAGAVVAFVLDGYVSKQLFVVPGRQPVVQETLQAGEGLERVAFFDDPLPIRGEAPDPAFAGKLEAAMAHRAPRRPRVVAQLGDVQVSPPCDAEPLRALLAYRVESLSTCHGRTGELATKTFTAVVQMKPGGRVARVLIEDGPGVRTPFGSCVARWFKRLSLPGHATVACRVRVPVQFEVRTPR